MKRSVTRILKGSNGAICGPATAQKTTSSTRVSPSRPKGSLQRRRSTRDQVPCRATGATTSAAASASERCTDTGIQPGNDEVGDRHREGEQGNRCERGTLHQRVIAKIGGINDQLADAGASENVLGEDSTR